MTEALELTFDEVLQAGRLLFGPGFTPHARWQLELRAAFRRRSFETHPDRAVALGRAPDELAREFTAVSDAYRALAALRVIPAAPHRPPPRPRPAPAPRRDHRPPPRPAPPRPAPDAEARREGSPGAGASARSPFHRTGQGGRAGASPFAAGGQRVWSPGEAGLPRRRLKLAEFLYYSGKVPWSAMVEAVAWQRRQRPAVGAIATGFGFLTPAEVAELLARRLAEAASQVPFGEYALREGYLTPFQLLATLGRQLRLQRPIGQFFVERGLLDDDDLELLRHRMFSHNLRWR
ncbi:J domain-containing protein [Anaeromyxobacter paludicola]|uniref:J domain-containing protein n=1 Tax=Anaeromyxobacter paludicola TaxID=2918171 RepID=A0ABN6N648_9BACT|nr:J domain-containing protein [Anaeromyxobacter paludicola]BDG08511.1 hypothetical protein AMPC_16240 [Anaeromyxobacter paludicola]